MNDIATAQVRPLAALSGPQVWDGSDMAARTDWIRPLQTAEIAELEAAVEAGWTLPASISRRSGQTT